MKKTLSVLFVLLISCITAYAQIQNGFVRSQGTSYNRTGSPLKGARVFIKGLNGAKVTGGNGTFNFNLGGGKTQFSISNVLLTGHKLLTPLASAYNVGKAPVEIVMQSREERRRNEARISKEIEKRITNSYNVKTAELRKKISVLEKALAESKNRSESLDNELSDLKKQIDLLDEQYLKRNDLVDKMVEQYVNLDYATMDDRKAELCSYIELGELEKADSLLNTIDINKVKKDVKVIDKIRKNKIDTICMYYQGKYDVAVRRMEYDTAAICICQLVDADTLNIDNIFRCACFFQQQNNYESAEKYYKLLLRQIEKINGRDFNVDQLHILACNNLSALYRGMNNEEYAKEHCIKASRLCMECFKEDPNSYIWLVNTVVNSFCIIIADFPNSFEDESFEDSFETLVLSVLEFIYSDNNDDDVEIQEIRNTLLKMFTQIENEDEQYKRELIEYYDRLADKLNDDNDILKFCKSLSAQARLYVSNKDFELADPLYNIESELFSKCKNISKDIEASLLFNLAFMHAENGKTELAEKEYSQASGLYKNLVEENADAYNFDYSSVLHNLAAAHVALGKNEFAEKEYRDAINIRKQLSASSPQLYNPDLAMSYNNLANLYWSMQRFEDSEEAFKACTEIYSELYADNHKMYKGLLANSFYGLGICMGTNKKYGESIIALEKSLKLSKEIIEEKKDSSLYLMNLACLSTTYFFAKDYESSYTHNKDLLQLLKDNFMINPERWKKDYVQRLVSQSYYANLLGKFEEGEKMSLEALKVDSTQHIAYTNLAASLLFQGKIKKAKKLYRQYKNELKDGFLNDFLGLERLHVFPKEYIADVERIKNFLKE